MINALKGGDKKGSKREKREGQKQSERERDKK